MIVLLSPAKSLNMDAADPWGLPTTTPVFAADAEHLVHELKKLSQSELKALLAVSDDLAKLNYQRYKAWHDSETPQRPCVLAFNGPAYQHLRASEFTKEQATELQGCLRVLSGIYGLLKPLDLIKPYRLDMGRKLRNSRGPNLYAHWSAAVAEQLNKELEGPEHEGSRFVINCASQEYFKVVDTKSLKFPVYSVLFPGLTAIYAKQARGAMVRHIIVNGARTIKAMQAFTGNDGEYRFDSSAPGPAEKLVFKRVAGASKAGSAVGAGLDEDGEDEEGGKAAGGKGRGRTKQAKTAPARQKRTTRASKGAALDEQEQEQEQQGDEGQGGQAGTRAKRQRRAK